MDDICRECGREVRAGEPALFRGGAMLHVECAPGRKPLARAEPTCPVCGRTIRPGEPTARHDASLVHALGCYAKAVAGA
ncbi:MAG TPA: hypothetical protein VNN07_10695 [Candidatus Tectomicrobia bacterium]|nr:hypothetical protein [Candidatus Tectomicrobia bacterium]